MNETIWEQRETIQNIQNDVKLLKYPHICYDKDALQSPCSDHGKCLAADYCHCDEEWRGTECEISRWTWITLPLDDKPPPRDSHSSIVYQDSMWIFGGRYSDGNRKDLWRYSFDNHLWNEVDQSQNEELRARRGHSAVVYHESMWIFGGHHGTFTTDVNNEVWQFSFSDRSWNQSQQANTEDRKRGRHSAVVYHDAMWIFGGTTSHNDNYRNDFWRFSFSNHSWSEIDQPGTPPGRSSHSAVVYHDAMWIFSGNGQGSMEDLWRFSFSDHSWSEINHQQNPPNRRSYSAVVYDDAMWIFGGLSGVSTNNYRDDFWRFSFSDHSWSEVTQKGTVPMIRWFSGVVYNDSMWVFGGSHHSEGVKNDLMQFYL